jgi:RND family efflux transporter MFP subunit
MKTKMKTIVMIMGMLSLLTACNQDQPEATKNEVETGTRVKFGRVVSSHPENNLKYSGTIEASVSTPLSFQTTGTVEKVYFQVGDVVKKGQLIASIDKTTMQSAYDAALAQYEQAIDAQERLKTVYDKGSLPEIKWVEINSQLAQAEAQMKMYKEQLDNCELHSPVDGIVGYRALETGMSALQIQAPISIITIDDILVKISVPEDEVSLMIKGQAASIKVGALGMKTFHGEIDRVGVVANQLSRTYDVKIRVKNTDGKLKPGMVCDVEIKLPEQEAVLLVPMEAVSGQTDGEPYVFVVNTHNKRVIKTQIHIGGIINNKLEILSGLSEGELIVTYGKHKLSDDEKVVY